MNTMLNMHPLCKLSVSLPAHVGVSHEFLDGSAETGTVDARLERQPTMKLIRLERNYSSWSLRAYLMLCQTGAPFEEVTVPILDCDHMVHLRKLSPSGKVPVVHIDGMILWETMAIGEYLHERFPEAGLYPQDSRERAAARCIANEMHAGFVALREHCPMDIRSRLACDITPRVQADLSRIEAIWSERLLEHEPFLFGAWSLADAMYAPVVTRLQTYGIELNDVCRGYCQRVLAHPWMRDWCEKAALEQTEVVPGLDGPTHARRR